MGQLVLRNVSVNYGSVRALQNVNLTVNDGDFLVVFGPSGAGKTTMLNVVAGVKRPQAGQVLINGQDVITWEPWQRDVAMVFENYALYPHKTVFDNIASPLIRRGVGGGTIRDKVRETAAMLGIDHLLDRSPAQISNGQKQRVAIGRAIVRDSQVLLMDEPLAHLDAKLRNEMRTEFIAMKRQIKRTVVYVTHDYREAMALADHLVVLRNGIIEQEGQPAMVYSTPASVGVAQLFGSPPRSLVTADIEALGEDGVAVIHVRPWNLKFKAWLGPRENNEEQIVVAMPSASVTLAGNGSSSANSARFRAPVALVEQQGSYAIVTVGDSHAEFQFRCQPDVADGLVLGKDIELVLDLGQVLFYDGLGQLLVGHPKQVDSTRWEGATVQ